MPCAQTRAEEDMPRVSGPSVGGKGALNRSPNLDQKSQISTYATGVPRAATRLGACYATLVAASTIIPDQCRSPTRRRHSTTPPLDTGPILAQDLRARPSRKTLAKDPQTHAWTWACHKKPLCESSSKLMNSFGSSFEGSKPTSLAGAAWQGDTLCLAWGLAGGCKSEDLGASICWSH